jgi:membrane fusion protein, multidrug efflux system
MDELKNGSAHRHFLLSIIPAFYLLLIFSCKEKKEENPKPKGPMTIKAEGYVVRTSTLNQRIEAPGTLLPYDETEIHPEVAGKIVTLNIADGQTVQKGALMVKLFDGDLQAQLRKLRVQLAIARKNEERVNELLKINAISRQDYDLAVLQVSNTSADISITEASLAKTVIRAPFSGKVGFRNVAIGAYVSPSTVICKLSIINKLKLEFTVPEKYSSLVSSGNLVNFSTANNSKQYQAKVIATEAGIAENTRTLKVRAVVENVDKGVEAGGFAKVTYDLGDNRNAIMVPSQAIIPQARGKKVIVYQGGVPDFRDVTTGTRDSANVQILSGVTVGDTILTSGLLAIKPTSKVQVVFKNK